MVQALQKFDILNYSRVGLINDSCILFRRIGHIFEWIDHNDLDYCGLTDSPEISYHIQSYFIIIKENAIRDVYDYFMANGIVKDIDDIIHTYEVGICRYLIGRGLKIGAYFCYKDHPHGVRNPMYSLIGRLIEMGMPLIKKRIIFHSYDEAGRKRLERLGFKGDGTRYINLIRNVIKRNKEDIDFDRLIKDST